MGNDDKNNTVDNGSEKAVENDIESKDEKNENVQNDKDYDELKERMLRLAAEFDNYKRRAKADADRSRDIGRAEIARDMLSVLDELELALMTGKENGSESDNMIKGVEMVYTNFYEALRHAGLTPIPAEGKFDPELHEIIMTRESDEQPGEILEVMKRGYTLGGIMLRPASVIVAGGKNDKDNDKKQNR